MTKHLRGRLSAVAAACAGFLFASAAHATTIQFEADVSFTSTLSKVALSPTAIPNLDVTLTAGGLPVPISDLYNVTAGPGAVNGSGTVTATFNFTMPVGMSPTSGSVSSPLDTVVAVTDNGNGQINSTGSLTINWEPASLFFTYGGFNYQLLINLADFTATCSTANNNCLANLGPISSLDSTFQLIQDSAIQVPEPGTLALLGSGLLGLVFLRRRVRRA